jgi:hypothetical protein
MKELLDEALSAQGGMRWAEKYLCTLIIEHPYCVRQRPTAKQDKSPNPTSGTVDLLSGDIPRCLTLTNDTAAALRVKLARIYSRLHQWSDQGTQFKHPLGLFNQPELGESIVSALRASQAITQLRDDDDEELSALTQWATLSWRVGYECASLLAELQITEAWMEAWSLASNLVDYRMALRRAVQRGLLA